MSKHDDKLTAKPGVASSTLLGVMGVALVVFSFDNPKQYED